MEDTEVANGFLYVFNANDRNKSVKAASMIPASTVQLQQLTGISAL